MDNPLGIASITRTPQGRLVLTFAEFHDQDPSVDHSAEWADIVAELGERELIPLSLSEARRSDFDKLNARVSSSCL